MNKNGFSVRCDKNLGSIEEPAPMIDEKHDSSSFDTPLRGDAFDRTDEEKIKAISWHFSKIMEALGLDLTDDSLKGTPLRVARMYVKEIFSGLDPGKKPAVTLFRNKYGYGQMLVEKNIAFYATCEHHFVPIVGKAHVGYISSGKIIGLSKINRMVQYYARRPQVQERMTIQIANELKAALDTKDVAVMIEAVHFCVASRGVQDAQSSTITAEYGGAFKDEGARKEFLSFIK